MKSVFAITYIMDDPIAAAQDLCFQIKAKLSLAKNNCAILFAEIPFELEKLLPELEKQLALPIIGLTSASQISSKGYHRLSATLMVLSADDCNFSMALSNALQADCTEEISKTYNRAATGLGGAEPELILLFSGPHKAILDDDLVNEMNRVSNGKPIFGGVCSDYNSLNQARVFLGTEIRADAMALLLISGNIKPKFSLGTIAPNLITKAKVTDACVNEILTIDDYTAYDYLKNNGVEPDSPYSLFFHPLSLDLTAGKEANGRPVAVARVISRLNKSAKSAICKTHIPKGTSLSVRDVNAKDIEDTTKTALKEMCTEYLAAGNDYKYTTMLGISCVARHIVLAYKYEQEGQLAQKLLPPGLNFMGCYSYGEYCPTSTSNGRADNMTHNISIALCMF